jgi:hypothetical protein
MTEKTNENFRAARPSSDQRFGTRVIRGALPLQIYYIDERGHKRAVGSTVASRTVEVAGSGTVVIEPPRTLTSKDWDTVIGLMREMRIEGLRAEGQMTDALLGRITQLDHLTYLSAQASAQVTDAGLRHLAGLPHLEHLDLSGTMISDQGLEILRELPRLKAFKLVHTSGVSDVGLGNLSYCDHLEHVDLMGTPTGDGVIKALTGKAQVRELFCGNNVTDAGLALLQEFPVFKKWLASDQPTPLSAADPTYRETIESPNHLWLNLKSPITNEGLAKLERLDGLYSLTLFATTGFGPFYDSNSAVTAAGLSHLRVLPSLRRLGCCANLCSDEAMRHISALPRLRFLMCQDTVAGDEGFAALSRSRSIEQIWGRRSYNVSGRGFAALAAMPKLRGLSMSCRNVDDEGLSSLPRFPSLREFMPINVSDDGFRHVGHCKELEILRCMYCGDITDRATEHIAGLSQLKSYQAWSTEISDRSMEILGRMPSLENIVLHNCPAVTNAGLAFLAQLPRLREITIESLPRVTSEGPAMFPANVRVNIVTE